MAVHRHQGSGSSADTGSDIVRQASTDTGIASHGSLTRITTVRHRTRQAWHHSKRIDSRRTGDVGMLARSRI